MDPLVELRKIQEQRYLAQLAKENEKLDAEKKKLEKEEREKYLINKYCALFSKNILHQKSEIITRFMRKNLRKTKSSEVIYIFGEEYPISLALELNDNNIPPFDNQEAKNAINAYFRNQTKKEFSLGYRLTEEEKLQLMLVVFVNLNRFNITTEDCLIPCLEDGILDFVGVGDMEEIFLRHPFSSQDEKDLNGISFWFSAYLAVQNIPLPFWISSDIEFLMTLSEQKIRNHIENLRKRGQYLEEMMDEKLPDPNDRVMCPGCESHVRFGSMLSRPGGSIYFCKFCAPRYGIELPVYNPFDSHAAAQNDPMEDSVVTENMEFTFSDPESESDSD